MAEEELTTVQLFTAQQDCVCTSIRVEDAPPAREYNRRRYRLASPVALEAGMEYAASLTKDRAFVHLADELPFYPKILATRAKTPPV